MPKHLDLEFHRPESRDVSFVNEMLVAACFPPGRPLPTVDAALACSHAARWLRPVVGSGDVAVVAVRSGRPVGAAVGRCFRDADPSWGVVAADVPELAMAVVPEERGQGVGRSLLKAWLGALSTAGFSGGSLTVSQANPLALHLYEQAGFREVARDERRVVMRWNAQ